MDGEINMHSLRLKSYAVSEIVGSLLLIVIAVLSFSAIYFFVFPLPQLSADTHANLEACVDSNGYVIIEHVGGESFLSYRIDIKDVNGTLIDSITYTDDEWGIGECIIPTTTRLISEDSKLRVMVFDLGKGSQVLIFDGILQGRTIEGSGMFGSGAPMLISSLLTNTTDEDLICFNKTINGTSINVSFPSTSYVYTWLVDGSPMAQLL